MLHDAVGRDFLAWNRDDVPSQTGGVQLSFRFLGRLAGDACERHARGTSEDPHEVREQVAAGNSDGQGNERGEIKDRAVRTGAAVPLEPIVVFFFDDRGGPVGEARWARLRIRNRARSACGCAGTAAARFERNRYERVVARFAERLRYLDRGLETIARIFLQKLAHDRGECRTDRHVFRVERRYRARNVL